MEPQDTFEQARNVFEQLRNSLQPTGSLNVVSLRPIAYEYYPHDVVLQTIDYLERRVMMAEVGLDELSPSDKMVLWILLDAAGIKSDNKT